MITAHTIEMARSGAQELRRLGKPESAEAVECLVDVARKETMPTLDLLTTTEAANVFGVTGQTIKNWVKDKRIAGYKVGGRIMLPREAVMEYTLQARTSLDLEAVSDEEAAALVAEGKRKR